MSRTRLSAANFLSRKKGIRRGGLTQPFLARPKRGTIEMLVAGLGHKYEVVAAVRRNVDERQPVSSSLRP
ncbi:hypothetical protein BD830_101260 [Maritimibacter alkaliphilus HTCC2654]|nr:hypothetical protein BD830_101260 [Maritimibacter alkaliphilus HTCC2654]